MRLILTFVAAVAGVYLAGTLYAWMWYRWVWPQVKRLLWRAAGGTGDPPDAPPNVT